MSTNGNTALYDAIKAGIEMTDSAASGEEDICTLVVLTDGQANVGKTLPARHHQDDNSRREGHPPSIQVSGTMPPIVKDGT